MTENDMTKKEQESQTNSDVSLQNWKTKIRETCTRRMGRPNGQSWCQETDRIERQI